MTAADRYATPTAFRRALTDRLKSLAGTSRWTVPQLQRHVAYDRLHERLYLFDRDWVVKGATALMARQLGTRGTLDIDLYREISLAAAEADLTESACRIRRARPAPMGPAPRPDRNRTMGPAIAPMAAPVGGEAAHHRPGS